MTFLIHRHCAQALRKAIGIYLLESPAYYTKQYHEMKVNYNYVFSIKEKKKTKYKYTFF
jgi:hypothetical protein